MHAENEARTNTRNEVQVIDTRLFEIMKFAIKNYSDANRMRVPVASVYRGISPLIRLLLTDCNSAWYNDSVITDILIHYINFTNTDAEKKCALNLDVDLGKNLLRHVSNVQRNDSKSIRINILLKFTSARICVRINVKCYGRALAIFCKQKNMISTGNKGLSMYVFVTYRLVRRNFRNRRLL